MDPVIVVGAGPVGLTLALALARHGVPSVLLDEGDGTDRQRPAQTVVLRDDTADLVTRLADRPLSPGPTRWTGWRSLNRRQLLRHLTFEEPRQAPVHLSQHTLTSALRTAAAAEPLVQLATGSRLDAIEQERTGLTAHTRNTEGGPVGAGGEDDGSGAPESTAGDEADRTGGSNGTWWRGSYLVGCDGARSTVRKLLDIRFPGRTGVERHAVAALRAELPWPGEAVLHRMPPGRLAGSEVTARPLEDNTWRLDWLLPPRGELVTPESLVARVRESLAVWHGGTTPPYELLDTGVHTVHHRLARRWRADRVFLAGDAAHLLGALGTQGLDEGLRDADNLAWKLALVWHHGPHEGLLDSYQTERRAVIAARLRAADQALPILRGGGLRAKMPGTARGHDALLTDGHLGRGPLGAPGTYPDSPLTPAATLRTTTVETPTGAPVADVAATGEDGAATRLRDRLGHHRLVVVLVAPGTGVWARHHWVGAGVMPRLAEAVSRLPHPAELVVAEHYPGAAPHTVLLIRPDGHLAAAFNGVHPADLHTAAQAVVHSTPAEEPSSPDPDREDATEEVR
ncbi:FAD-dependent monooxygenase [Streptomyces sp. NPDC058045]|uniref:FAD-dependent monooxygenase n=1 Tax=Streptomyces sp. NPDC058045 TaxID=3346311 RepID=UPI0036EF1541